MNGGREAALNVRESHHEDHEGHQGSQDGSPHAETQRTQRSGFLCRIVERGRCDTRASCSGDSAVMMPVSDRYHGLAQSVRGM
jgi:hypothetical protein